MATPTFDDFYAAAQRVQPGLPLDSVREIYRKRYDRGPVLTQGPPKRDYLAAAERLGIDPDTAGQEYEKRYNTLGVGTDIVRGVKRGFGNIVGTVGGGIHAAGGEGIGQSLMDYAGDVQRLNRPEAALNAPILPEGGGFDPQVLKRPDWWAQGVAEVGTSMIPAIAAGLATGGAGAGPVASAMVGGAVGGAQEGFGGTYRSRLEEGVDKGQATREALAMSGATAGLNAFPLYRILGGAKGGLTSRAITGLSEGVTELAEEPAEALITGKDPVEATRQGFGVFPLAALTGGLMQGSVSRTPAEQRESRGKQREEFEKNLRGASSKPAEPGKPAPAPRTNLEDLPDLKRSRPVATEQSKVTSSGTQIEVTPTLVEAEDLITSFDARFPKELQPRDRNRDTSILQIQNIAQNLDPVRLRHSPEAGFGAPVVDEKGIVRDGNGRVEAIKLAYRRFPENAQAYKADLEAQGLDTSGYTQPVLVDQAPIDVLEGKNYELEANQADQLRMGAAEVAQSDAKLVDPELVSAYQGGDIDLAKNQDFVRRFISRLPAASRGDMVDDNGRVSQAGVRRIQGALMASAYGENGSLPGLSRMLESTDDNTRAITGALIDAAPYIAELRGAIQAGQVAPEYDIGGVIANAAQQVSDARRNNRTVDEVLRQQDAFNPIPDVEAAAIEFFAGVRNRSQLAKKLQRYAETAQREGNTAQGGLLGGAPLTPQEILRAELQAPRVAADMGEHSSPGARAQGQVREWIQPITSKWKGGPNIYVLEDWNQVPKHIRDASTRQYGEDAAGSIGALRVGDDVYILADRTYTEKQAVRRILHEAVGHYGMENMLSPRAWARVKRQTIELIQKDKIIKEAASYVARNYSDAGQVNDDVLASEIIAKVAETNPKHPLIQRILAHVREWLRAMGFDHAFPGLKMTRKDLEALLIRAGKHLEKADSVSFDKEGNPQPMVAYHGSPNTWDTPASIKELEEFMGTGEGVQAYGWGLYAGEKKETGEHYRKTLGQRRTLQYTNQYGKAARFKIRDEIEKEIFETVTQDRDARAIADQVSNMLTGAMRHFADRSSKSRAKTVREQLDAQAKHWAREEEKALAAHQENTEMGNYDKARVYAEDVYFHRAHAEAYEFAKTLVDDITVHEKTGHLYEFDVPDAVAGQMLVWDAPVADQLEILGPAAQQAQQRIDSGQFSEADLILANTVRQAAAGDRGISGKELYKLIGRSFRDNPGIRNQGEEHQASVYLNDMGIPGHKFLEAGSRGGVTQRGFLSALKDIAQRKFNLVIYDPAAVIAGIKRDGKQTYNRPQAAIAEGGAFPKSQVKQPVFHGAAQPISDLDSGLMHFTNKPEFADKWGDRGIYHVNIENPHIVENAGLHHEVYTDPELFQEEKEFLTEEGIEETGRPYDGVIIRDSQWPGLENYVVFDAKKQVRKVPNVQPAINRRYFRAPGFEGGAPPGWTAMDIVESEAERGWVDETKITPEIRRRLEGRPASDLMWVAKDRDYLWREFGPDKESGWRGLIEDKNTIEDITDRIKAEGWEELPINDEPDQILMIREAPIQAQIVPLEKEREFRQSQADFDKGMLFASAEENQEALVNTLERIAPRGAEVLNPGIKKPSGRIDEKAQAKGGYGEIRDVVRAGVKIDSMSEAEQLINDLAEHFDLIAEPPRLLPNAYMNQSLQVRFENGQIGEVQLGPPAVWEAKLTDLVGDHLYDVYRSADTPPEIQAVAAQAMRDLYTAAATNAGPEWRQFFESEAGSVGIPLGTSSGLSSPADMTSAMGTARQTLSRIRNASASGSVMSPRNATRSPSQSANLTGLSTEDIVPQAAMAERQNQGDLPPSQGNLFGGRPPPGERGRLEGGGGSYSARQFANLSDSEFQVLSSIMDYADERIADQRGGRDPKTWQATELQALEMIVRDPEKALAGLVNRQVGSAANSAELEAYGMMLIQAVENVEQAAEIAFTEQTDEALANLISHYEKMSAIQAPYAGYMTEAGRALNILAKAKESSRVAGDILEAIPDHVALKLRGSTTGNRQAIINLAESIVGAESRSEVLSNSRKVHKPDMFDKIYEYWVNSILSGPDTHMVNNASNALFQIVENTAHTVGGLVPGGGGLRPALARWHGGMHGLKMGARAARKAFITGEPVMGAEEGKIEVRHTHAINNAAGPIIRAPGRALLAEDEFWKGIAYYQTASEIAMRRAMQEGGDVRTRFAEIMGNLEQYPDIIEQAKSDAHRLTFTTKMGPVLTTLNRALIKSRIGKFIAPFVRTPSNILKEAVRYTPGAGLAIRQVREDMAGKNGPDARAMQTGRWLVGSSLYAMAGALAAAGDMSGNGPDDRNERRLLMRTGWQPYSVRINGKWYKYNRLEPVGMVLGLAADGIEIAQYAQGGELDKLHALVMGSLMNNLGDKTFLSGVFDFAEAMSDPQRYAPYWIQRQAASFVPNIVGQPTWKADPLVREARTITDRIRSRIPGKRQELNALVDVAGEPVPQTSSNIPGDFRRISPEREDPLAETMLRLGLFRGKPGRTVQNVKLTDDEYSEYATALGQARWRVLTPYVRSPQFQAIAQQNPEVARYYLDKLWTKIGNDARIKWLYENPEVLVRSRNAKAKPKAIGSNYVD